ncbi:hypothetical protein T09_7960 [Trichinella sp. T9]|nr:hypothetical protein T09_7960 [Trichinella sp. T9]
MVFIAPIIKPYEMISFLFYWNFVQRHFGISKHLTRPLASVPLVDVANVSSAGRSITTSICFEMLNSTDAIASTSPGYNRLIYTQIRVALLFCKVTDANVTSDQLCSLTQSVVHFEYDIEHPADILVELNFVGLHVDRFQFLQQLNVDCLERNCSLQLVSTGRWKGVVVDAINFHIDGDVFFLFHEQKEQRVISSDANENVHESTLNQESCCLEKNQNKYIIIH